MRHPHRSCFLATVFLCVLTALNLCYANDLTDAEKIEFFNSQVKPILQQNCFECHGNGDTVEGGLELTGRERCLRAGIMDPRCR